MSMDDGDELGKEIVQTSEKLAERAVGAIARAMMNARSGGWQDNARAANIQEAFEPDIDADVDGLVTEGGVEYKKLLVPAEFEKEARYVMERLGGEHIEFYTKPEDIDRASVGLELEAPAFNKADADLEAVVDAMMKEGAYRTKDNMVPIYVPLRDPKVSGHLPFSKTEHTVLTEVKGFKAAQDFSEGAQLILETYDHEAIRAAKKLEKAYEKNASLIPQIKFDPEVETNFTLEHKTLEYDLNADYLHSRLEKAGIPHVIEKIPGEAAVNVTFDPRHANAVRDVLFAELEAKRFDLERFPNYEALQEVAVDMNATVKHFRANIESPEVADIIEEALLEAHVNFDIYRDPETQIAELTVPETELSDRGFNIALASANANRLAKHPRAADKITSWAQRRSADMTRIRDSIRVGQEAYERERKANINKDYITSRKSADARNRDGIEPKRTQSRSK